MTGDEVIIERAIRLVNIELHAVALQRRRLASSEPEDDTFDLRWWTDLQFFIVALYRLRRYAGVASGISSDKSCVETALATFDAAVPELRVMRNIGEHTDEYALDSENRRVKSVDSKQLEVGSWNGQTYDWLGRSLDVDKALDAGECLFRALNALRPTIPT